jgi:hypothetical protein
MHLCRSVVVVAVLLCGSAVLPGVALIANELPTAHDPRLIVERFAAAPDIVHPVSIAFDQRGRLLVIESHTHFRPANYQGPKHDRIRVLEDTDGDGRADRFRTFFEGTTASMDIATHRDGSVYVATRNEVLRLRDTDGDGQADEKRRVVFLDTPGNYPHNGLSGLAFDANGNLFFGMGENLGARYRLIGSDGGSVSDEGEGGNIFWCTADGQQVRRVATGFWNPFGVCLDVFGRMFAVDNDADAMPPCRLLHVVEGGDYGYQFRYGRSGRHPFQSWNGQLPGTLPMASGTGEGPCEVLGYEANGLPAEYRGDLLVTSWADHRVERYRLTEQGVSVRAERLPFVQGGKDFRPVGLAVAPDGSLFVSDWVLSNYELHSRGAVWHIRWKTPSTQEKSPAQRQRPAGITRLDEVHRLRGPEAWKRLRPLLTDADPFLRHAATFRLAQLPEAMAEAVAAKLTDPQECIALLLAQRRLESPDAAKLADTWLKDRDPEVRFLAAKWIADRKLTSCKPALTALIQEPNISVRLYHACASALARLNDQDVSEAKMADFFFSRLTDAATSPELRIAALRLIPSEYKPLTLAVLNRLITSNDEAVQREAVRLLAEHPDPKRFTTQLTVIKDEGRPETVRAEALVGIADKSKECQPLLLELTRNGRPMLRAEALRSLTGVKLSPEQRDALLKLQGQDTTTNDLVARVLGQPFINGRSPTTDTAAWMARLDGAADPEAGRRVFFHPKLAGCSKCHRVDGRGHDIGPDLSAIGRSERRNILESILQPSGNVAPHYQVWKLSTADGQVRTGMLMRTYLDEYTYIDEKGEQFKVKTPDITASQPARQSIMPDGLVNQLTDQELRDLLAYLCSRK